MAPTISEIEKILESHKDTVVEGFYITGHLLEDKIDKRGANLAYVCDILYTIDGGVTQKTFETSHEVKPEKDGYHHKITVKAKSIGGSVVHDITINYFVQDTEAEEAEREELKELLDEDNPMVFENKHTDHGILDARVVDKYGIVANLGAMFGYAISLGDKQYAQFMGVRCAALMERVFGKKKE